MEVLSLCLCLCDAQTTVLLETLATQVPAWAPRSEGFSSGHLGLWSTSLGREVPGSQGDMSTQTMFQVPGITQTKLQVPQNFPRHPTGTSPLPGPAWASTQFGLLWVHVCGAVDRVWNVQTGGFTRMYKPSTVQGGDGLQREAGSRQFLGVIYHLLKAASPFCSLCYSTIKLLSIQILSEILSEGQFLTQSSINLVSKASVSLQKHRQAQAGLLLGGTLFSLTLWSNQPAPTDPGSAFASVRMELRTVMLELNTDPGYHSQNLCCRTKGITAERNSLLTDKQGSNFQ